MGCILKILWARYFESIIWIEILATRLSSSVHRSMGLSGASYALLFAVEQKNISLSRSFDQNCLSYLKKHLVNNHHRELIISNAGDNPDFNIYYEPMFSLENYWLFLIGQIIRTISSSAWTFLEIFYSNAPEIHLCEMILLTIFYIFKEEGNGGGHSQLLHMLKKMKNEFLISRMVKSWHLTVLFNKTSL